MSDTFPENRATAIGLFSSIFNIGAIIGPNLGGWIVSHYSWRYVFYINLPIGILLIGLIMVLIGQTGVSSKRRTDYAGALLMASIVLFFMFALNLIGESLSYPSVLLAVFFVFSTALLLFFFLRHERREANPILDLALLQSTPFLAANLLNFITGAAAFGILSFIPFYVTSVHRLSTLVSGMVLTPRSVGVICSSSVTSFMLARWGYRRPMICGLAVMAFSTLLLGGGLHLWGFAAARWGVAPVIGFCLLFAGLGAGIAFPAANNACIELMPEKVATIVGLRGMFRMVGAALGVSLDHLRDPSESKPRFRFYRHFSRLRSRVALRHPPCLPVAIG